jgi:branched-chain amino acid transport system ATP-binding protein
VSQPPLVDCRALRAGYGWADVLKGVDLEVQEGEFVAVLGANGAGKSTLFKCLSGALRPRHGSARVLGVDVRRLRPHDAARLGVGQVAEGRPIFPGLSVLDHLRLARRFGGDRGRKPEAQSLEDVYALFPILRERRDQLAGQLSGGQQQMLLVARALIGGPRLLLLDEPSLGLAPVVVQQIFRALERLRRDGISVLLIEQSARAALSACDRAYVLRGGKVVREGRAAQMLADRALIEDYLGGARRGRGTER